MKLLYKTKKWKDRMSGAEVTTLQKALKAEGYKIAVDGVFWTQTDKAVRAYQKAKKLKYVDGIVGKQTWGVLFPAEQEKVKIPESENFKIDEFRCKDRSPVPEEYYGNLQKLMKLLEAIRYEAGGRPIKIVSGYRSPSYNKRIGGALKSQHMTASAADIRVLGVSMKKLYAICDNLNPKGGVGKYTSFIHVDVRGKKSRW